MIPASKSYLVFAKIRVWWIVLVTGLAPMISYAKGEVIQVEWPTRHAAEPIRLGKPLDELLPSFRFAIQTLPESSVVTLALSQPALLGLNTKQADRIRPLVAERYRKLSQSPEYANVPSALPYCFSEQKPTMGLASVYVPSGVTAATPVIVFLHGYGGSFLWYLHYLSESFPNHIIICPAYGISSSIIPQVYVDECLRCISLRLGFETSTPHLLGLSAGGFGACRLYESSPKSYRQMICLGAYPPDETLTGFTNHERLRFIVGGLEPYVTSGDFRLRLNRVRKTCFGVEAVKIDQADHFFLLTHQEETRTHLERWLSLGARSEANNSTARRR